jgi:alkanesulfonate monooxygenase SsuD/methylene tetrahydromethanopterin reductase-like flavin-dependent oxidoreductase (luciferase family)
MQFHQAVAFLETDQYVQLAQASEDLGFSGMYVSDHLFYPKDLRSRYTYSPYDDVLRSGRPRPTGRTLGA